MATDNANVSELDALLNSAVDAIVMIDRRGLITKFSHAAEQIFGYQSDEVIGLNVSTLMPEPFHSQHDQYLANYANTGQPQIIGTGREVIARKKSGETFPIDLSVGEFSGSNESGFVGIIRDISERKRVETELREREKELALTIGNAPFGILTCDLQLRILTANQAFLELLRVPLPSIEGSALTQIVISEDRAKVQNEMARLVRGEQSDYRTECRLENRRGNILTCRMHSSLVRDDIGQPRFIVTEFADLTAQIKAEQEAAADREKLAHAMRVSIMGEMSSSIAHELNQPLAAISLFADTASRLAATPGKQKQLLLSLEKISSQAIRAGEIIARLRNFVSQPKGERCEIQIVETIREAIELANVDLRADKISLQFESSCGAAVVYADALQIQQVILNLIRNAIDAIRGSQQTDGSILVRCQPQADGCHISVIDSGPGVDPKIHGRLFQAFATTKAQGMGIGLSLSRSIVEAHGGRLTYDALERGGAHFKMILPLAQ